MGSGVKLRGTHQIAHIFQKNNVRLYLSKLVKTLGGHSRIQVAHAAGVKLDGGAACLLGHPDGIYVGVDVRLHHRYPVLFLQAADEGNQGGGFPRPGGGHNVDKIGSLLPEPLPEQPSLQVVVGKHALLQ